MTTTPKKTRDGAPASTPTTTVSVTKILTSLRSVPSNRSCADCKAPLMDSSQVHASYSPMVEHQQPTKAHPQRSFLHNHAAFAPPQSLNHSHSATDTGSTTTGSTTEGGRTESEPISPHNSNNHINDRSDPQSPPPSTLTTYLPHRTTNTIPPLGDWPVDPAASPTLVRHGVFVCALCGAAHKLLGPATTVVQPLQQQATWTVEAVQWLASAGGNAHANRVLEAYYSVYHDTHVHANGGHNDTADDDNGTSDRRKHHWGSHRKSRAVTERDDTNRHPSRRHGRLGLTIARRPVASSTVAERLEFVRTKYQALGYILPPSTGPLASEAWAAIVDGHPEWRGLRGASSSLTNSPGPDDTFHLRSLTALELRPCGGGLMLGSTAISATTTTAMTRTRAPPDRLVDYFCVVTASKTLHQDLLMPEPRDLSGATGPEDILLTPDVQTCLPRPESYMGYENSNNVGGEADDTCPFPEHVSTFVFPDGCYASSVALPPMFFTLVLTNAAGERLYGGVLRLYDDDCDCVETLGRVLDDAKYPESHRPEWLRHVVSSPNNTAQIPKATTASSDVMFMPKCLVVLSHYPFFDLYRKFLLQIYRIALTEAPLPIERFVLNFVQEVPLPPPGQVQIKYGFTVKDNWTIERPPENELPLANFSFKPLFAALSASNVLVVMGLLVQETRIVLLSKHYAMLGPIAEALLSLLFPFHWQGIYLPITPYSMIEILDAPVPFLVGLHSRYLTDVPPEQRPAGVVFVDLDKDIIHLGLSDSADFARNVPILPDKYAHKLKAKLVEHASCIYVPPQKPGGITTGTSANGDDLPLIGREAYSMPIAAELNEGYSHRRKDVFTESDKAYQENELLVPISGFLFEEGQFRQHERSDSSRSSTKEKKRKMFSFAKRLHHKSSTTGSEKDLVFQDVENLLNCEEPQDFSSEDIRESFLRFFVSSFQGYRDFLEEKQNKKSFRAADFIESRKSTSIAGFITSMLETQMFQCFIQERKDNPNDPEVLFFDDSIAAKENRSKLTFARGGKKETAFLDNGGSSITESFTPPQPSNWGLPAGEVYHYATFPELNSSLFGQPRRRMTWKDHGRGSLRNHRQISSIAHANEQAVMAKATHSLLTKVKLRGVRNLETALKTLSTPFAPVMSVPTAGHATATPRKENSTSDFSELTLESPLHLTPEIVSLAEEIILNARRKQAILLGIIIKLQACCRMHLVQNGRQNRRKLRPDSAGRDKILNSAAVLVQSFARVCSFQQRFARIKRSVLVLQALFRCRKVLCAYQLLLRSMSKVQALCRGVLVRKDISIVVTERMRTFRRQVFSLWRRAFTPLVYRSKIWPLFSDQCFLHLAIAETELMRLWEKTSAADVFLATSDASNTSIAVAIGLKYGLQSDAFRRALKIQKAVVAEDKDESSQKGKVRANNKSVPADRIVAEKTQLYEKLAMPSNDVLLAQALSTFSIASNEKMKKAALVSMAWANYNQAGASADLLKSMFPELIEQPDIHFVLPSKKAMRRFPCTNYQPAPIDRSLWAHRIVDDMIQKTMNAVARASLDRRPGLKVALERSARARQSSSDTPLLQAFMTEKGIIDKSSGRVEFMKQVLIFKKDAKALTASAKKEIGAHDTSLQSALDSRLNSSCQGEEVEVVNADGTLDSATFIVAK